ncbi:MAG: nicotinate-nucleotide adenylyltransferase [Gammaproteobacteria bacterium]|nr:nicotinate-nucleotide adenylyltransferase [Gammaproteobacteria bacterium]MDH5776856.1 nicotinate-nucleotide adenylyltransferase [Gammaproteobacteria bacterium]
MIGVFGGTFDPIHLGHIQTVTDVAAAMELEQVLFIPVGIPPHRDKPIASAEQRLAMVNLAIAANDRFVLDDREIRRPGPSYMVETLGSLREQQGETTSIGLILGLDAFCELDSWHQWQEINQLAHLIVMTRPGWDEKGITSPALQKLVAEHQVTNPLDCHKQAAGSVVFLPVSPMDISSTQIRKSIRAGLDVSTLLPTSVNSLIQQEQIY